MVRKLYVLTALLALSALVPSMVQANRSKMTQAAAATAAPAPVPVPVPAVSIAAAGGAGGGVAAAGRAAAGGAAARTPTHTTDLATATDTLARFMKAYDEAEFNDENIMAWNKIELNTKMELLKQVTTACNNYIYQLRTAAFKEQLNHDRTSTHALFYQTEAEKYTQKILNRLATDEALDTEAEKLAALTRTVREAQHAARGQHHAPVHATEPAHHHRPRAGGSGTGRMDMGGLADALAAKAGALKPVAKPLPTKTNEKPARTGIHVFDNLESDSDEENDDWVETAPARAPVPRPHHAQATAPVPMPPPAPARAPVAVSGTMASIMPGGWTARATTELPAAEASTVLSQSYRNSIIQRWITIIKMATTGIACETAVTHAARTMPHDFNSSHSLCNILTEGEKIDFINSIPANAQRTLHGILFPGLNNPYAAVGTSVAFEARAVELSAERKAEIDSIVSRASGDPTPVKIMTMLTNLNITKNSSRQGKEYLLQALPEAWKTEARGKLFPD